MNQPIGITLEGQRRGSAEGLGLIRAPVRALYAHVPFCFHKCHYCDFYSFVDNQNRQAEFTDRLIEELAALALCAGAGVEAQARLTSIFVGGGTPSLLRVDLWERLLAALRRGFDLTDPGLEFTVECNPETVTAELMAVLVAGGVNRVSVGAQSFDSRHLKALERWHDPENVAKALALAETAGIRRRNIDLIFAIPGQTIEEWERDLERALALEPEIEHISCYALTYEAGTAMTARMERGDFARADEDLEADMYTLCVESLRARGLDRYEVSNFARSGCECRHNLSYWRQDQWLAAGPSASAHAGGARWKNVPRLGDWMEGVAASGGASPVVDFEAPDARRALAERLMTGLRLREGIDAAAALRDAEKFGAAERLAHAARRQAGFGLLTMEGGRWRLTDHGFLQADGVAGECMGALEGGGRCRGAHTAVR